VKGIKFLFTIIAGFIMLASVNLSAGGGGSYPNGAEGFLVGAAPPPGFYMTSYTYNYNSDSMLDDKGDEVGAFDKINVWGEVLRFIWISKLQFLGGTYGQHLFVPILDVDLDFKAPLGPKGASHYTDFDLPYLIYSPFLWTFHKLGGKLHFVFSFADIYIPTNSQKDEDMANISHNFWTIEPAVGITYLPTENTEISFKFMYDFNTTQDDSATVYGFNVDRTPGQEFHFDYNFSYAVNKNFRVGLGGYFYTQTTDDDYDIDSSIPAPVANLLEEDEGHRSIKVSVGPGFWFNHKNIFMTLRVQPEIYVRNGTKGLASWLKVTYCF